MASIPESDWVGQTDHFGRQILYIKKIISSSFYTPRLAIIIDTDGHLELMIMQDVVEVVLKNKPALIFRCYNAMGFSLKGGGKTYFGNGDTRSIVGYKMDYDPAGNMWLSIVNAGDKPMVFLSYLWIVIIKREIKRRRKRKETI